MHINGEDLYYEVEGTGQPLVLIHGWTLNLRMWDPQVASLGRRFRIIRVDRRGFGRSSGREDSSWDAADLAGLLDHLGVETVHILGMSAGGDAALRFARTFPGRASSLILHGTVPPHGFPLPWTGPDRPSIRAWQVLAQERGVGAFLERWRAHPLMEVPAHRPDVRARLAELLAGYRGEHLLNPVTPSGPVGPVAMDELPQLTLPALVVIGDAEVPYLQIVARTLAYYLPNARLAVIPGGGHMINLIAPDEYDAAVLHFLETIERRG